MYPIVTAFLLFLSFSVNGDQESNSRAKVSNALGELRRLIDSGKPFNKNPLNVCKLESFASRSHLYYYRALGNSFLAKNTAKSQKLFYLNRALSDLRLAKMSPGLETERIDQLINSTLKDLIEVALVEKNNQLIIGLIEQLPQSDMITRRYIVYYAYALFNSSKEDDFKKLVGKYLNLFSDEKNILSYLNAVPPWHSLIATVSEHSVASAKAPEPQPKVPLYSKGSLLADPRVALNYLNKHAYFSAAESVFKLASDVYFSLYKKADSTPEERKFRRLFQRGMYFFAPSFIDGLITAHWKQADLKTAERLSKAFLKQYEGHSLYPKVLFNLGRIQEDAKNYRGAFTIFKRFIASSDNSTYLELARFRSAWVLHLAKREADAKPYFAEYVKHYPDGRYASTCEYYLLKPTDCGDKSLISEDSVKNFIAKYPFNLYSYILADELKLTNDHILKTLPLEQNIQGTQPQFNAFKADIKTLSQLALVRELLEFGLTEDAIRVLKSFSFDEQDEVFALFLAAQFHELKDTHGEVKNLIKAVSNLTTHRQYIPWKNLFPQYRCEAIEKALADQNSELSVFLILSIIRQESLFEPKARSTANALGLMQLTQGTAKEAAHHLELKDFSLLKEEDNLKLGIRTIAHLLRKFDNRLDYALSAYNAGETATRLWIKLRGDLAPMEFIESIPFQETRVYVKGILRNYAIYRMLYDERPTSLVSFNCGN